MTSTRTGRSLVLGLPALLVALLVALAATGCGARVYHQGSTKDPHMVFAPKTGTCHDLRFEDLQQDSDDSTAVSCNAPHTTLTIAVEPLTFAATDEKRLSEFSSQVCRAALAKSVGGTADQRTGTIFTWADFYPTSDQQSKGARWMRCDLVAVDGNAKQLPTGTGPFVDGAAPAARYRYCAKAAGENVAVTTCDHPHDASYRTSAVSSQANGNYPGQDALRAEADRVCRTTGRYLFTWPSHVAWDRGDRRLLCFQ